MTVEAQVLLWIHGWSSPALDRVFWLSHLLGTGRFCFVLVTIVAIIEMWRGDRREAWLWVALGLSTYFGQLGLKLLFLRDRPDLWSGQIAPLGHSFPSGHALAGATFYPLLGRIAARSYPRYAILAYALAVLVAALIGVGRLYLGVHWPSDVVAGWMLGAAQTWLGARAVDRARTARRPAPEM